MVHKTTDERVDVAVPRPYSERNLRPGTGLGHQLPALKLTGTGVLIAGNFSASSRAVFYGLRLIHFLVQSLFRLHARTVAASQVAHSHSPSDSVYVSQPYRYRQRWPLRATQRGAAQAPFAASRWPCHTRLTPGRASVGPVKQVSRLL